MTKQYREPFANVNLSYKKVLEEVLRKRGFTNQEIVFKWTQIVGSDLAELYIPHSIKYTKASAKSNTKTTSKKTTQINDQSPTEDRKQGYQMVLYLVPKNGKDFYKFSYYKASIVNKIEFFFGKNQFSNVMCTMQDR